MKTRKKLMIVLLCVFGCLLLMAVAIGYVDRMDTYRLLDAIEEENVVQVSSILDSGTDPNRTNIPPSKLWRFFETSAQMPLAQACKTGNLEIVGSLIDHGATAAYTEYTGWSALQETLFYYQPDDVQIVKLLLENGADPQLSQGGDIAPVFRAAQMRPAVYDKNRANGTVFATGYDEASAKGITEIVVLLLGNTSVDVKTSSGQTLLMYAAKAGNLDLTKYLLSEGCDKNCRDASGKTALDYAIEQGEDEIVALLGNA